MTCLVYYQVGDNIPNYLFDSLYQVLVLHGDNPLQKIYIITNKCWVDYIKAKVNKMDIDIECLEQIEIVPCETLSKDDETIQRYTSLTSSWNNAHTDFRGGFWLHTTNRFLYLAAFMKKFDVIDVFHIESDIMIYTNLNDIYEKMKELNMVNKIVVPQDAPNRAICSVVFIPSAKCAKEYSNWIVASLERAGTFLNDMDLMGYYQDKYTFPDSPNHQEADNLGVFDACAIGQYLGGIDFRNIPKQHITNRFINPTRGFINETSVFKANTAKYLIDYNSNKGKKYKMQINTKNYDINALHIHSKQLYLFSSKFDIPFEEIITGDRIIGISNFVFCDKNQFNYTTNLMKWNRNVFLVKDFQNVNYEEMNNTFTEFVNKTGSTTIRLFVFIDNMMDFMQWILPHLDNRYTYILYSHNGDYAFDLKYIRILDDPKIKQVYAQNLDISLHPKLKLLPIGIAREVFPHGNLECLYTVMTNTYINRKEHDIYINLNASTHSLRVDVINALKRSESGSWDLVSSPKPYKDYLLDLCKYRFGLCVRGNGLDTHRFWECLYLRVVPVVVYDPSLQNFLDQLDALSVPYYKVESCEFFEKTNSGYFSEELYKMYNFNNVSYLKMSNYVN